MKSLNFSSLLKALSVILLLSVIASSCKKDPDPGPGGAITEDGLYIKGAGTAFADFNTKAQFKTAKNEVVQTDRAELVEIYMAVKKGTDGFNIVDVKGTTQTVYGPGADWAIVTKLGADDPKQGIWKGNLTASSNKFTVPEDGLYHVIVDLGVKKVTMVRVKWGVIGAATPGGWSNSTPMVESAFDLNKMTYTLTKLILLKNEWKFKNADGWKVELDSTIALAGGLKGVKANTNFGGTISALSPGGANFANDVYGEYTVTLTWEAGKGHTATAVKTGDGPVLALYPDNLYMIGDGIGGWTWKTNDLQMNPVNSHPELFWRIVYMDAAKSVKFSPVQDWMGDFGITGTATNGVFKKGSTNAPTPATAGYYMVVVNLKDETVEIVSPGVFMLGDAVNDWTAALPANKFTVGANNLTFTKALVADKEIRMHVAASTLKCDWWQAEFIVLNGKIEFRGKGGDQTRVKSKATGNTTVTLDFKTNTGSIL
jgi:Outer membrane protein SusF_SusE